MKIEPISTASIRKKFPALSRKINNSPAVYFDGPGGSQVPQTVASAMSDYILNHNANCGGCFTTGKETVAMVDAVRDKTARFLNCASSEVSFGQNMTSLTFSFSRALAHTWQAGDNIIVSQMDHDANITTWRRAAEDHGVEVRMLPYDHSSGTISVASLEQNIDKHTKLVAITCSSNILGSHVDVISMRKIAHQHGAKIFIDAVHHAPHNRIDVAEIACDFLVCSVYKFFGPHIGILYGKKKWMHTLPPYKIEPSPSAAPACWETGTQNFTALAGLDATLDYLLALGGEDNQNFDKSYAIISSLERSLMKHFLQRLKSINHLQLHGIKSHKNRAPSFALTSDRHTPQQLSQQLADHAIFTWNGHMYAVNLIDALQLERKHGVLRIGLLHYNTHDEIDRMFDLLEIF